MRVVLEPVGSQLTYSLCLGAGGDSVAVLSAWLVAPWLDKGTWV